MSPAPVVRRIEAGDGAALREVRLAALATDPDAFGSSFDAETGRTSKEWEQRAARAAAGGDHFIVIAEQGGEFVAMAGAYRPKDVSATRVLYGMWVSPAFRQGGLGSQLVEAVKDWAVETEAKSILLWVVRSNEAAHALYRSAGFSETGKTQPQPSNPALIELELVADLVT